MKAFDRRMIKRLGYMAATSGKEMRPECLDSEPCVMCEVVPTTRTRLVPYMELRSLGFPNEWADDDRFFVHLCRLCHLLWQQRNVAWRREYGKCHGITPRVAERRREGKYLEMVEKLEKEIQRAQEIKTEYGKKIEAVEIAVGLPVMIAKEEPHTFYNGIVSYIDATHLRQGSVTVFVMDEEG